MFCVRGARSYRTLEHVLIGLCSHSGSEISAGEAYLRRHRQRTDAMTEPISTRSLDRYGSGELSWSRPLDILTNDTAQADVALFAATKRPDGRRGIWLDGALHFTSGSGTLESLNLAANPALQCVGAPAGHRPGAEGRGSPGHRRAHLVAGGGRSLQGRLAGHRWTGTRSSRQTLGRHRKHHSRYDSSAEW